MVEPTNQNEQTVDGTPATAGHRRLAVLGSPIAHSLSPALHAAAYRVLGLDWEYTAVDVAQGELDGFLDSLTPDWLGLSLTMPLKHDIQPRLTDVDRIGVLTGAVNTVRFTTGGGATTRTLTGYNTDVAGLVRALAEVGTVSARHVTVLGAGATAASAVAAAAELGAESVEIIARTPARAEPLVDLARKLGLVGGVSDLSSVGDPDRASDLVISTLPGDAALPGEFPPTLRGRRPSSTWGTPPGPPPWPPRGLPPGDRSGPGAPCCCTRR
jgi:shikimate dehydrogenase